MSKFRMGLFFIIMCMVLIIGTFNVMADEKEEKQGANEVEVTVEPDDNGGSVGIMDEDIVVIEEDVIDNNKNLAPVPGSDNKVEKNFMEEDIKAIDDVPKTSDCDNIYLLIMFLLITLIGAVFISKQIAFMADEKAN